MYIHGLYILCVCVCVYKAEYINLLLSVKKAKIMMAYYES